ncbi:AI-2E family transporter [Curvivirga sp.]|uniref:AI-2E family transporter n=1 Tax=Curvivirga sp. TaxID=2856848 RepID=UPI003B5C72F1
MTTTQKSFFWVGSLAVFVFLLMILGSVLVPFVAGMAIAYFLDPVCDWLEAHGFSRTISTTIVTIFFTVILAIFFAIGTPLLVSELQTFLQRLPGYVDTIWEKAVPLIAYGRDTLGIETIEDLSRKTLGASGNLMKTVGGIITRFIGGINVVTDIISFLVLTPIVAFYFLRDWDRMVAKIDSWLPRKQQTIIRKQFSDMDTIIGGFVRGQSMVCISLGIFYAVGLALLGLDFGLLVGFFTGLVSFIPYFGMLIGFALGMGIALAQFDTMAMVGFVAIVFAIGQVIEGYILTPRLIGNRVGLHPVWIIFALMAGGALFGFLGILIAVPVTAVIGVLARFAIQQYMASPLYQDMDAHITHPDDISTNEEEQEK